MFPHTNVMSMNNQRRMMATSELNINTIDVDGSYKTDVNTPMELAAREIHAQPSVWNGISNFEAQVKTHQVPHTNVVTDMITMSPRMSIIRQDDDVQITTAVPQNTVRLAYGRHNTANYLLHPRNVEAPNVLDQTNAWKPNTTWLLRMTATERITKLYFALRSGVFSHINPLVCFIAQEDTTTEKEPRSEIHLEQDTLDIVSSLRQETLFLGSTLVADVNGNVIGDEAKAAITKVASLSIYTAIASHTFRTPGDIEQLHEDLMESLLGTILFLQVISHAPVWGLLSCEEQELFTFDLSTLLLNFWTMPRRFISSDELFQELPFLVSTLDMLLGRAHEWVAEQVTQLPKKSGINLGHLVSSYLGEKRCRCAFLANSSSVDDVTLYQSSMLLDELSEGSTFAAGVVLRAVNTQVAITALKTMFDRTRGEYSGQYSVSKISETTRFLLSTEMTMNDLTSRDLAVFHQLRYIVPKVVEDGYMTDVIESVNHLLQHQLRCSLYRTAALSSEEERHYKIIDNQIMHGGNEMMKHYPENSKGTLDPSSAVIWGLDRTMRMLIHRLAPFYGFEASSMELDNEITDSHTTRVITLTFNPEIGFAKSSRVSALRFA